MDGIADFCTSWTANFLKDDDGSSSLPFITAPFIMVVESRFLLYPHIIPEPETNHGWVIT